MARNPKKRKPTAYLKAYRILKRYSKRYKDYGSRREAAKRISRLGLDKITVDTVRQAEREHYDLLGGKSKMPFVPDEFFQPENYFNITNIIANVRAMPQTVEVRGKMVFDDPMATYKGGDEIPYVRFKSLVDYFDSIRKSANEDDYELEWYIRLFGTPDNKPFRDVKTGQWYVDIITCDSGGDRNTYGYKGEPSNFMAEKTIAGQPQPQGESEAPKEKIQIAETQESQQATPQQAIELEKAKAEATKQEAELKRQEAEIKRQTNLEKLMDLKLADKITDAQFDIMLAAINKNK